MAKSNRKATVTVPVAKPRSVIYVAMRLHTKPGIHLDARTKAKTPRNAKHKKQSLDD
jgi:hypothetical protein